MKVNLKLLSSCILFFQVLLGTAQNNRFQLVSNIYKQIIIEPEFPGHIVGEVTGNVSLDNPSTAANFGFNYQRHLDHIYLSTSFLYTVEDIEYDAQFLGITPGPDPALEGLSTRSVLKRQLTTMFAVGLRSEIIRRSFFFVELGPLVDLALSSPPLLGPLSSEVNNFGLGLYTEIGFSFNLMNNFRPEGLVFEIALFSAYNYEVFNVAFDSFLLGTNLSLGYRW